MKTILSIFCILIASAAFGLVVNCDYIASRWHTPEVQEACKQTLMEEDPVERFGIPTLVIEP